MAFDFARNDGFSATHCFLEQSVDDLLNFRSLVVSEALRSVNLLPALACVVTTSPHLKVNLLEQVPDGAVMIYITIPVKRRTIG